MITHIVLMKFTEPADAPEAKTRLEAVAAQIPEVASATVGLDVVHSDASYDLALVTTHDSIEKLKGYQGHPVHHEFAAEWLRPRLSARVVVDYEV